MKQLVKKILIQLAGRLGWRWIQARDGSVLLILMYHRVLPLDEPRAKAEEPGMLVSRSTFDMHLKVLTAGNISIVRLTDWIDAKLAGKLLPKFSVAITFDDGWLDNYQYAFPLLQQYKAPATMFAVSDFLGKPSPFWPNHVLDLLAPNTDWDDSKIQDIANLIGIKQLAELNNRCFCKEAKAETIRYLKKYDDSIIWSALEHQSKGAQNQKRAIVSKDELKELSTSGLVDIGSHTSTHKRLNAELDDDTLFDEIVGSKIKLEEIIGKSIDLFCFPNGDYSERALELVKRHYKSAVTTKKGVVYARDITDLHKLTRIGVHDDITNTPIKFTARLTGLI